MSSVWLDKKYINLIAVNLPRFGWKSAAMANFRCVVCGDSKQHEFKARAYLYPFKNTGYMMKCHNCGLALPFPAFLKRVSRTTFDDYIMEKFNTRGQREVPLAPATDVTVPPTRIYAYDDVHQLSSASLPDALHPVRAFIRHRQLPTSAESRLYGTTHAHTWLTPLVGRDKSARVKDGVPYLVVPLRLADRSWYGAQVRPLDHKQYLTFRWTHDHLRTFGLDANRPHETTYIFEGPLDALCVPNALAMCGADLMTGVERTHDAGHVLSDPVLVWDNEPRSQPIVQQLSRAIDRGHRVVIWPRHLPKDANDMVAAGIDVLSILASSTFSGLRATVEFQQWKKI
jgi:hypothetical protein